MKLDLIFIETIIDNQEMLRPFAARGNRNLKVVKCIDYLSKSQQRGDWVAYLADEKTYKSAPTKEMISPDNKVVEIKLDADNVDPLNKVNVNLEEPWKRIYVLVFIKNSVQNQRLQSINEMMKQLQQESFFEKVDANDKRSEREYLVAEPWRSRKRKAVSMFLELRDQEFEVIE